MRSTTPTVSYWTLQIGRKINDFDVKKQNKKLLVWVDGPPEDRVISMSQVTLISEK
jgi:hypothetical protein